MMREIVTIDENLCDGCGLCIPSCAEGALKIVDGKAKLLSARLCDGMGACLGHCPKGAIKIEQREAQAFDEEEVERQKKLASAKHTASQAVGAHACPGSMFVSLKREASAEKLKAGEEQGEGELQSELMHWPVQLRLLAPHAPVLRGAHLLVAADCVPVAYPDFHRRLLKGHAVVISCPKFDDNEEAAQKLAEIIAHNELTEITVARMSVPCCGGIVRAVLRARELAASDVKVSEVVIDHQGRRV
jgi:NAD-dependent dihydropyrimidine dehydrogenase PreA subunit